MYTKVGYYEDWKVKISFKLKGDRPEELKGERPEKSIDTLLTSINRSNLDFEVDFINHGNEVDIIGFVIDDGEDYRIFTGTGKLDNHYWMGNDHNRIIETYQIPKFTKIPQIILNQVISNLFYCLIQENYIDDQTPYIQFLYKLISKIPYLIAQCQRKKDRRYD